MTPADIQDTFQIGRVVNRTFGVLGRNVVSFLLLAGLLTLPSLLLSILLRDLMVPAAADNPMAIFENLRFTLPLGLVGVVLAFLLQACLVQGTVSDLNGVKPALATMLSSGFGVLAPVVGISILAYLGVILGLVLLLIPGIILALMWSVIIPVRVVENTGVGETFARSRALTKGSRWKIFALLLLFCLIAWLVGFVLALGLGLSLTITDTNYAMLSIPYLVVNWLVSSISYALIGAGVASVYYELRTVKEGVAPQQLAAAFD